MQLVEDEKYYFDPKPGQRIIEFIEGNLKHVGEEWDEKPFTLLEWQKTLIYQCFGFYHRASKLRRFNEVYIETAKGAGKTPLLTAIGLAQMLSERNALIVSAATDFAQANLTFDAAKKFIRSNSKLDELCTITQYRIEIERLQSRWIPLSGEHEGRSGSRPSVILASEAHEWPDGRLYRNAKANAIKRKNSLIFVDTNAGARKEGICWELHEAARKVLDGTSKRENLYAVIHAAPTQGVAWDSPEAAAAANPSWGVTMTWDQLQPFVQAAKESTVDEAQYKRKYLGWWLEGGGDKFLDLSIWDKCCKPFDSRTVIDCPLYVGLDLSQTDDLSACALCFSGDEKIFWRSKQWIPKPSADKHERQSDTPFKRWAKEGLIKIINRPTIDEYFHKRLAAYIIKLSRKYDLRAVVYDRRYASLTISKLERAGIVCIPMEQGYALSQAAYELERRLKAGTITIEPNACVRWQAGNVECLTDRTGNIRIVKEGATRNTTTGRRGAKIDSIAAALNAIAQIKRAETAGDDTETDSIMNAITVFDLPR